MAFLSKLFGKKDRDNEKKQNEVGQTALEDGSDCEERLTEEEIAAVLDILPPIVEDLRRMTRR